jgi:hypothetical protein
MFSDKMNIFSTFLKIECYFWAAKHSTLSFEFLCVTASMNCVAVCLSSLLGDSDECVSNLMEQIISVELLGFAHSEEIACPQSHICCYVCSKYDNTAWDSVSRAARRLQALQDCNQRQSVETSRVTRELAFVHDELMRSRTACESFRRRMWALSNKMTI